MYKSALIGLQDVPSGVDGVNLARRISPAAQLTLLRVHRGYRVLATGGSSARAGAERGLAESDLDRASQLTGVEDKLAVGATSTVDGLIEGLRLRRSELLVLSAAQILARGETMLGSLGQLNVPIAVTSIFASPADRPVHSIGVVNDQSADGARAFTVARRLATSRGIDLAEFDVGAYRSRIGIDAATRAAREISEFASTVDVLVIAVRAGRVLRHPLDTAAIEEVIAASPIPVLLVPPGTNLVDPPSPGRADTGTPDPPAPVSFRRTTRPE